MTDRTITHSTDQSAPHRLERGALNVPNGILALAYPLYAVTKPGRAYPYNLVPIVVFVWLVAGVGLFLYYRARSPEKITAPGTLLAEDDLSLDEQLEALLTGRASSIQRPTLQEEMARHPAVGRDGR